MDEPKVDQKPESIRDWYDRTTRKARRALAIATAVSVVVMGTMWFVADLTTLQKLQTFNGALTVPLIGGLWIFSFIFMFLVPSREASFRAQEVIESVAERVAPAAKVWERLGARVEKEYPEIRKKIEESIADLKKTSERVEKAVEDNAEFVEELRPVLATLKRIEDRIEEDLLDDVQDMVEAVKRMSGIPVAPPKAPTTSGAGVGPDGKPAFAPSLAAIPPDREPNLSVALSSIGKRKEKKAAEQPK